MNLNPIMELNLIIALALAFGIGLSLGLLGSGGSIITLPVLVYVAGCLWPQRWACRWQLSAGLASQASGGSVAKD